MIDSEQKTQPGHYRINLIAQALGRFFSIATTLFIFMLAARLLNLNEFGQFSYIMTFLGMTAAIAEFGTTSICSRELSQQPENNAIYWANFLFLRIGFSLLVMLIAMLAAYKIEQKLFVYLFFGCLGLPFIASRFFDPIFQIYNRPWYSTISSVSYSIAYLLSVSFILLFFYRGIGSFIASYIGANILYTILASILSGKLLRPQFKFQWNTIKHTLKLAWPIGVSGLIIQVNSRADIFMLAWLQSDNEVAIYNAAYRFLDMAATFAIILVNPIIPIFSRVAVADRKKLKNNFIQIFEVLFLVTVPIAILTPYISPVIIHLIFGPSFLPSADALNILAWVGVLVFFSLFSAALCIAIGVVHFGWWNAALAASLNIFLNLWWIPKYGYIGSAWATLLCEILLIAVTLYYIIKHMGTVFRFNFWLKFVSVNSLLFCILSILPIKNLILIFSVLIGYCILLFLLNLVPKKLATDVISTIQQKYKGEAAH